MELNKKNSNSFWMDAFNESKPKSKKKKHKNNKWQNMIGEGA